MKVKHSGKGKIKSLSLLTWDEKEILFAESLTNIQIDVKNRPTITIASIMSYGSKPPFMNSQNRYVFVAKRPSSHQWSTELILDVGRLLNDMRKKTYRSSREN